MQPPPIFRSLKSRRSFLWPAPNRHAIIRLREQRVTTFASKGQGRKLTRVTRVSLSHRVTQRVTQLYDISYLITRDTGDTAFARVYTCRRARMRPHTRECLFLCVTRVTRDKDNEIRALYDTVADTVEICNRVRPENVSFAKGLRDTVGEKGCF